MDNTVTIVGNVTRDPEVSYTQGGQARAVLGVAVNRSYTDKSGNKVENTSFFNVVCWRDLAENVGASVVKGTRIVVNGRLEQRSWETENGEKRSVVEVVADEVAPSLRWATAQITKTAGSNGNGASRAASVPNAPVSVPAGGNDDMYEPF